MSDYLGSKSGIEKEHLENIKFLIDKFQPFLISDHLSWSSSNFGTSNDLLPIPYNKESLAVFIDNIKRVQDVFGRNILIENPTAYLEFEDSDMTEFEFLNKKIGVYKKKGWWGYKIIYNNEVIPITQNIIE